MPVATDSILRCFLASRVVVDLVTLCLPLQLLPGLSGGLATVAASPEHPFTLHCLQALSSFPNLKQLELSFADSVELEAPDLVQLASLTGLTSLRLHNASLPANLNSSVLTQLQGLQELSLVHVSKVSALMTGDSHLQVRVEARQRHGNTLLCWC